MSTRKRVDNWPFRKPRYLWMLLKGGVPSRENRWYNFTPKNKCYFCMQYVCWLIDYFKNFVPSFLLYFFCKEKFLNFPFYLLETKSQGPKEGKMKAWPIWRGKKGKRFPETRGWLNPLFLPWPTQLWPPPQQRGPPRK